MKSPIWFPKVVVCREIPQWIISSDKAAYHPFSNTIYIRDDMPLRTWAHEYGHWIACCLHSRWLHRWLDGTQDGKPR
jgi:hypothetical protein